jgi:cell shape-determining protein MreC
MQKWFNGIGILVLIGITLFQPAFSIPFQSFFSGRFAVAPQTSVQELTLQVAALKSELVQRIEAQGHADEWPASSEPVFVYSRYPFNFKNEIIIAAGRDRGIAVGDAVVIPQAPHIEAKPILVGKVIAAYERSALVRTVFDTTFQAPVRVGPSAMDTLFVGGPDPKLTLIPRNIELHAGDPVYSASPDLPYGLPIGTLGEAELGQNNAFQEASIIFPYDMNTLTIVAVVRANE